LSRERLAAKADISARTIYNLETGRTAPSDLTQAALARALECQIEDIFPINEPDPKAATSGPVKTSDAGGRLSGD
jgi:DNA-binding XRE family transcriptional regulator